MNGSMTKQSCDDFVRVLAGSEPVPGGGGAAALVGALGTALGNMVGSLTVGKKKYADVQDEIAKLNKKAGELQKQLLEMVDKDAEAFEPLSKAYGLPAETAEERADKERIMEAALKSAAETPYHIMELVSESIDIVERYAAVGSRIAVSDAGCAAACCKAALNAASLNVFINTRLMKDRAYAEEINKRAEDMLQLGNIKADAVFDTVRGSLI